MAESAVALAEVNGKRFGRLTAVAFASSLQGRGRGVRRWTFQCDCGKVVTHALFRVKRGIVRSCGCAELETHRRETAAKDISPFIAQHGRYETAVVAARLGLIETEFSTATINRAHSVIDGWIDDDIFERRHIRVIEHARDLWRDIKRPTNIYFDRPDPENRDDGLDAERSKALLRRARSLVNRDEWAIFENVVRWNEPCGIAGSRYVSNRAKSEEWAKQIVIDVAEVIAESLFL